jgi:hypothetical protein
MVMQFWKFELGSWIECAESAREEISNDWVDITASYRLNDLVSVRMNPDMTKFAIFPTLSPSDYRSHKTYWPASVTVEDMPSLMMLVRDYLRPLYGLAD